MYQGCRGYWVEIIMVDIDYVDYIERDGGGENQTATRT